MSCLSGLEALAFSVCMSPGRKYPKKRTLKAKGATSAPLSALCPLPAGGGGG